MYKIATGVVEVTEYTEVEIRRDLFPRIRETAGPNVSFGASSC